MGRWLLALMLVFAPSLVRADDLADLAVKAVGLLYAQDSSGSMNMRCTATAYEKTTTGYRFVTAAHCIGEDKKNPDRSATGEQVPFFVTFDETQATKKFHPATVVFVGYQSHGEDFAVVEVQTTDTWTIVPMGDEKLEKADAKILNIASPLGLGIQVIRGTISSVYLDRPVIQGDINWKGSMLLSIATVGGGSSGSAVISERQKAIVGFLVGTIGENNIVAIPVSKFKKVAAAVRDGKYKYYNKTGEAE